MADKDSATKSFSITLPIEAIEMITKLVPKGLYGKRKATIASQLILDKLKEMDANGVFK